MKSARALNLSSIGRISLAQPSAKSGLYKYRFSICLQCDASSVGARFASCIAILGPGCSWGFFLIALADTVGDKT